MPKVKTGKRRGAKAEPKKYKDTSTISARRLKVGMIIVDNPKSPKEVVKVVKHEPPRLQVVVKGNVSLHYATTSKVTVARDA